MKYHQKLPKSSSARTTSGHRPSLSSSAQRRSLTRKIVRLEERLCLQEGVLLAVLHHMGFRSTTSHENAPETLH